MFVKDSYPIIRKLRWDNLDTNFYSQRFILNFNRVLFYVNFILDLRKTWSKFEPGLMDETT